MTWAIDDKGYSVARAAEGICFATAPLRLPSPGAGIGWSLDFVMDTPSSGRRFRVPTLVDDFSRECLGLVVETSLTVLHVVRELGQIIESRGCPRMIVSDNGTEFTSNAILAWQERLGIEWHYIAPGKLMLCRKLQRSPA